MGLANMISLGGVEFTDDGRTYNETRDERAVEVELANGSLKKYVKAEKRIFEISWTHLPQTSAYTSDRKGARNELRPICYNGSTTTLVVRNVIGGGSESYVVFVNSYSEEVKLRDPRTGNILYEVKIELKER